MASPGYGYNKLRPNDELAKPLPQNLDAERSLIGAVLLDNKALAAILAAVPSFVAGDFFLDQHRRLFAQMLEMHKAGTAIDLVTLPDELHKQGQLESAGGVVLISSLMDGVPAVSNVGHWAKIVKEKSMFRKFIHTTHAAWQSAINEEMPPEELIDVCRTNIAEITTGHGDAARQGHYMLKDFMAATFPPREHLVEGLIPRKGTVLILAMPHRLKSWFTTGIALACTRPGKALGALEVKQGFRTMLVQVEEQESELQWRIGKLLLNDQFSGCDTEMVGVIGRGQFNEGFTPAWSKWLREQLIAHKAELVILDVLRRFFVGRGDINSPNDMALFCEEMDRIVNECDCSVALVHHANRKEAELMAASAGSFNLPGWANTVMELKRKTETGNGTDAHMTCVEIEADDKYAPAPEGLRLVLQLNSPNMPLRIEEIGESEDWRDAKRQLNDGPGGWTIRELAEVLGVHRSNASRRLYKWEAKGILKKLTNNKSGTAGGHARFQFVPNDLD